MNGPARLLLDLLFPPRCVFCGRVLACLLYTSPSPRDS